MAIVSKPATDAYRDGWERTFGDVPAPCNDAAATMTIVIEGEIPDHDRVAELVHEALEASRD